MVRKVIISLLVIVVSFISFLYSTQYILYDGYIFKPGSNGELVVLSGQSHIGEVIHIKGNDIFFENEKITYEIKSEKNNKYDLRFYTEDGIEFGANGFSTREMVFESDYRNIGFNGPINKDEIQFEEENNSVTTAPINENILDFETKRWLIISATMTYFGLKDFNYKIKCYFFVEIFIVILAIIIYIKQDMILKLLKKNTTESRNVLKYLCVAGPSIGSLAIHLLRL